MKKRLFALVSFIFLSASLFAEEAFNPLQFVSFKSNLRFIAGEDSQSYTAERRLKPFAVCKFETTYSFWYQVRVMAEKSGYVFANKGMGGSNGRVGAKPTDSNSYMPVCMINWYDSIVWCNALSELKGKTPVYYFNGEVLRDSSDTARCDLAECRWENNGYRLPSESEWEYASRKSSQKMMPGNLVSGQKDEFDDSSYYAWDFTNTEGAHIVGTAGTVFDQGTQVQPGSGNANQAGLFDMSGNIMEFCWDWFAEYTDFDSVYGPESGFQRVCRGGSFSEYTMFLYCADRYSFDPNEAYDYTGFRIAYTVE